MTDPTERPQSGSISEATRRAVQADRAKVEAAERAARRRRGSLAGRLERGWKWLRNRQSGPVPRARRVAGVLVRTARDRGPWRELPEALATALLAPVRLPGRPPPPKPPRDWELARAAAAARLAAFSARSQPASANARPRVAVIADAPALDAYRAEWHVLAIRPEDWGSVLTQDPPELLVVDAPRNGNHGAWAYRVAWAAHPDAFLHRDLDALTSWCAARSIPTVFRAREGGALGTLDWRDAARLFDLVIAPDADAEAAFAEVPDRRGLVRRPGASLGAAGDGAAILGAVRAAAAA